MGSKEFLRLELVIYTITSGLNDNNLIAHLISSVEGDYHEICDQDKRVKLSDNTLNRKLLEALKDVGFISSYRNDKDKLQVYHKVKK